MSKCIKCDFDPDEKPFASIMIRVSALPSQNQLGANRMGRAGWKYRKFRKTFLQDLSTTLLEDWKSKTAPCTRFRGTVQRYYAGRERPYDLENLVGGCKPLIDALKELKYIPDDNPKVWRGYYEQHPAKSPLPAHGYIWLEAFL